MKKIVLFLTLILFIITLSGCQSLNVISEYLYNDKDYEIGNKAYDPSVYNIETIEVDWIVGNVYILQSSNHEIIIREETDIEIEDKFKMHYKLEDNTLDIKFAKSCNLLEYKYKIKNLYIFLPCILIILNDMHFAYLFKVSNAIFFFFASQPYTNTHTKCFFARNACT